MTLPDVYDELRPSIVAFVSTGLRGSEDPSVRLPYILGTGFVVDERGIIATNGHVIEVLESLPRDPTTGKRIGRAVLLQDGLDDTHGFVRFLPTEIRSVATIKTFLPGEHWFGESAGPDIGFVQINLREIPAANLVRENGCFRPGIAVATAGYSLGSDPVFLYGELTCPQPILRRGVISSVFPHRAPQPQGFTTDIMIQGGASGSPVFLCDDSAVIGVMHASLLDSGENTNISIAISSIEVEEGLRTLMEQHKFSFEGVPSLADRIESGPIIRID
jgi:S1-C subfamily serine protease